MMSKLTQSDDLGNWSLKGVPWKTLYVGQTITRDIHDKVYGALYKLMEYEDTGYSPENVEHLKYVLEDAVKELEKSQGQTKLTEEIWHYLNM